MPRNSSGSYSLPAGNPVVTGTSVSSTWSNTTMADLATEMTSSLDRSGRGQMLAPLPLADGSSGAPGLTFNSEPTSGLYRAATNDMRVQVGSTTIFQYVSTGAVAPLGLVATQSQTNTVAINAVGNGTAAAINAVGGSGGSTAITGTGTIAAAGVTGIGGPTNGPGILGSGTGTGVGVKAQAGGGTDFAIDSGGHITMTGNAPSVNAAISNALTKTNIIKVDAHITTGASPSINGGMNCASVGVGATNAIRLTFASAFADTNYRVTATCDTAQTLAIYCGNKTVNYVDVFAWGLNTGVSVNLQSVVAGVALHITGAQ